MRPWLVLGGMAIAVVALAVDLHDSDETVEDQIRRTLDGAVRAVEERALGDLMDRVSERFRGPGGMDRDGIKGVLFIHLRQSDWRRVFLLDTNIEPDEDHRGARVRTTAVLAGGDNAETVTDVAPTDAATYVFDLRLELEDRDWRVVEATYERARLEGLLERLTP
jgi:hypothetical protein